MTQEETNISDLERAVNEAMPQRGTVQLQPSYGLCVYVPVKQQDGSIEQQALTLLCGIETLDGQTELNLMEGFKILAVQNHLAESQLSAVMSRSAKRIALALQYAAEQLKHREES